MMNTNLYPDDPTDILRSVLQLEDHGLDDSGFRRFTGDTPPQARGRVFGGQVLAQSLLAASTTIDDDRLLHSMHSYFIRPGDAKEPISFVVESPRDGRSFSVRRVQAWQHGKVILSLSCSFQQPSPGLEHQVPMPEGLPRPEDLPTAADLLGHLDVPVAQEFARARPFDVRHVYPAIYLRPDEQKRPENIAWMKTFTPITFDGPFSSANAQAAALAYASDYTLLEPILRQHGVAWAKRDLSVASLDHSMWFHRPVAVDEWLLYVQESPSAQSARGLGLGRIYTRDGILVATVGQEGMVRLPEFAEQN